MEDLLTLGIKHLTDKVEHGVLPVYEKYLSDKRMTVKSVCEIGVGNGNSLRMWRDYFPNARIVGVDVSEEKKKQEGERIFIRIGDQSDPAFLLDLAAFLGTSVDMVIDDGSHKAGHQIATFMYLFPCLKEGGLFAIEDVYADRFGWEFMDYCKTMLNRLFSWPKDLQFSNEAAFDAAPLLQKNVDWWTKNVLFMHFHRYFVFFGKGNAMLGTK